MHFYSPSAARHGCGAGITSFDQKYRSGTFRGPFLRLFRGPDVPGIFIRFWVLGGILEAKSKADQKPVPKMSTENALYCMGPEKRESLCFTSRHATV